jgi:hypothetical protein
MLHSRSSKSKNPATGWVFISLLKKTDLHGNPARKLDPDSAQVAKTEGGLTVHHSVECKEFSGALQPPCLYWGFSGSEIDPQDAAVPHRLIDGV